MDPFTPLHGIPLEQYADLLAEVADSAGDPDQAAFAVAQKGVARSDWEAAHAGWTARLQDTALSGAVAVRLAPLYQAALTRRKGPPPQVGFEDFAAMCGEAMARGVEPMLRRHGLDSIRWSQISYQWHTAIAREPARLPVYQAMADQETARLLSGGAPRPVPNFMAPAGATAPTGTPLPSVALQPPAAPIAPAAQPVAAPQAAPPQPVAAPPVAAPPAPAPQVAPLPAPAPQVTSQPVATPHVPPPQPAAQPHPAAQAPVTPQAGAYQGTPPGVTPPRPQQPQTIEKQAEQALHSVGGAMSSGFKELGSALDSFGKSLTKPKVGSRVLVAWSDGNRYPGTVAAVGQGQYLVTMGNGQQHWIPEAYVKTA